MARSKGSGSITSPDDRAAAAPRVHRLRSPRTLAAAGVALLVGAVSAWLAVGFTGRVRDWGVMTDELLYAKLATSVASRHSPLPVVHEQSVGVINQIYPILISPFYGFETAPAAFHSAHLLNAPLMASAAIPAYLLAREALDRRAALAVAVVSVAVPWMALAGFLLTEVVAYPCFLWALLAVQRAVGRGSTRRDLLALGGIALAVLARVQFLSLAVVFPAAILAHELGYPLLTGGPKALGAAARATWRRHRLLAGLYGVVLLAALVAALLTSISGALGVYSPTLSQGSLLPGGLLQSAAAHLDSVAIGCGILPLVLGGGWMLTAAVRPPSERKHALAVLSLLAIVVLTLETASFDLRFGGRGVVRDRYVFYVVPLLLVGTAALLRESRTRWLAPAALAALFAGTVHWLPLPPVQGVWVDSPTRVLNGLIVAASGGLSAAAFVAAAGCLVTLCTLLALRIVPRRALAPAVFAALLAFSVFATQRVIDHTLASTSVSGRGMSKPPGIVLDWVDRVLPPGAASAIVPYPTTATFATTAVLWWDVEFWNRSVRQAFLGTSDYFHYTPFKAPRLVPDWQTGRFPGTVDAPPYVVQAQNDARFRLHGSRTGTNFGLDILAVARPYRAAWATRGLQEDGWTSPGRRATIRVFSTAGGSERRRLEVTLAAPPQSAATYRLGEVRGRIAAGATATPLASVCVPAGSFASVALESPTAARVPATALTFDTPPERLAGVRVIGIATAVTGSC